VALTMAVSTQLTTPVTNRDHILGVDYAAVTLVEYGDYACPHCNEARFVVKRLRAALGDRLRYVFRNFLTLTSYSRAYRAAEAAEASGAQNRFWQMHDFLYDHQLALSDKHLKVYATQVGLDMERFNRDMMLHTHALRVHDDILSAGQSAVSTAPAFFINDSRHVGPCDFETLLSHVKEFT
jgi:protein-disulfide isomerase